MIDSIVFGTDGSETAREAVRQAGTLAKTLGARVHLVSAYDPRPARAEAVRDLPSRPLRRVDRSHDLAA
jgi:nucleotide-binding universal stress UspA family protein